MSKKDYTNKMEKKLNYFTAIQFLSKYIMALKKHFFRFYIGWLLDSVISILLPLLYGVMLDEIVYRKDFQTFYKLAIVVTCVSIFSIGLYFLIYAQHHYILTKFSFDIRSDIYQHFVKCNARYLLSKDSGEMVPYFQWYPTESVHFLIRGVIHQFNNFLIVIAVMLYLFRMDVRLGFIAATGALISLLVTIYLGKWTDRIASKFREKNEKLIAWVFEMLSSIQQIHLLDARNIVKKKFLEQNMDMFEYSNKKNTINVVAGDVSYIINWIVMLVVYILAAYMACKENLTVGTFTVIIIYFTRLKDQIIFINQAHIDAKNRVTYIQKLYDFFQSDTEVDWKGKERFTGIQERIKVEQLHFGYLEQDEILKGLDFEVFKNEKVAIVGKSGCGKTTLAHLLIGLFTAKGGGIYMDDKRLEEFSLFSIRENVGIIEQEVMIFDGSIRYNLMLGNRNATDEELRQACAQAGLLEWIDSLPDGFEARIKGNGEGLSGGQKQRLGIARMYLKNPQIIIFDEATSALDEETEMAIFTAWVNVLENRTAFVISHKYSTVAVCDRVIVLKEGRVVSIREPEKLSKTDAYFKELFSLE